MSIIDNKDILFLINPNSGNKKGLKIAEELKSRFRISVVEALFYTKPVPPRTGFIHTSRRGSRLPSR